MALGVECSTCHDFLRFDTQEALDAYDWAAWNWIHEHPRDPRRRSLPPDWDSTTHQTMERL
jgi:hypothetical protein